MKIAILGYGIEGRSAAKYFVNHGHDVTVCDAKREIKQTADKKIKFKLGTKYLEGLDKFDSIFRSPGISINKKEFDAIRPKLTSVTKYFFKKCACPIVGVTGTKGKGTVSALIYEMAKTAWPNDGEEKRKIFWGGNIGMSPLDFLDEINAEDLVILELSSFQLQDLDVSPHVAVVLGITPDHMDYHRDMDEYVDAKRNAVKFQRIGDFAVVDADNSISAGFEKSTKAQTLKVSISNAVNEGGFLKVGSFIIKRGKTGTIVGEKSQTHLVGPHNIKNMLMAAAAASALNVPVEAIAKVIREFRGLPHRLEFIKEIAGARFYDDSASTNPHTTIAALRSFEAPIVLILGGSDKNTDFSPLGREIAHQQNIKKIVLMGETKKKLEAAIEKAIAEVGGRTPPLELISADSYQEAFMVSRAVSEAGNMVLLSPACASFDMFANYKERGEIFKNFVMEISPAD